MSDLISSLPHYHRYIPIYVVQIIDTILGRVCLLRDLHFIFLYGVNFYLTGYLNTHNHNICKRLPQTGCTARRIALLIISQDRQTQVGLLAANAMAIIIIID